MSFSAFSVVPSAAAISRKSCFQLIPVPSVTTVGAILARDSYTSSFLLVLLMRIRSGLRFAMASRSGSVRLPTLAILSSSADLSENLVFRYAGTRSASPAVAAPTGTMPRESTPSS
ncbi:Uncharacterised protein [Mycobacterium tuberculosis]|nr:Uncharacterised protein [Mycobacterium tuberculosis]